MSLVDLLVVAWTRAQAMLPPAGQHKPRNLGKTGFELIQVELKN